MKQREWQTVYTLIGLLLRSSLIRVYTVEEQSDQGLHCLPRHVCPKHLESLLYVNTCSICVISCFSLELRELEAKLKAAYMNKERMAQMAEKEAVKYDVMVS